MKYLIPFLLIAGLALYLNRAYAHIYQSIGGGDVHNPNKVMVYRLKSKNETKNELVYVALGDSLTAGVGANSIEESYPYRLAAHLAADKNTNITLVNLANPGATTADVLKKQIPLVAKYNPTLITMMIGTNDMHNQVGTSDFNNNLTKIFSVLEAVKSAAVNVITPPFIGKPIMYPPYNLYFKLQTARYNSTLRTAAALNFINTIDLETALAHTAAAEPNYYSPDGFHPNSSGYAGWSKYIYDHLSVTRP